MTTDAAHPAAQQRQARYQLLYVQVLFAIILGIVIGWLKPDLGKELKPLGDGFIVLIKMMIAPIIFCTVVHGISSMGDLKRVGRVGLKAMIYFEVVSTIALAVGLIVGEILKPGAGFNIDPAAIDPKAVATYVTKAKADGIVPHLMAIIPDNYLGALAHGDILQVLLVSILSGFAISFMGKAGEPITYGIDQAAKVFFGIISMIVRVAPILLRCDGIHDRSLRPRFAVESGRADRDVLSDQRAVRADRAGRDRPCVGLLDPAFHRLHQG
jgi:aerobic C4-dicarboxylate transport protein